MNRTPLFRKLTVACAAAASLGAFAMPSTQTSAWSYDSPSGSRGNVSLPTIYVGDLLMPSGYTQFTLYSNTGPTAYRSPAASGVQTVYAKYRVEYWTGAAWVVTTQSPLLAGQIGSTQTGVSFTRPYLQPTIARGFFRVTWAFDWYNAAGTLIGSTFVVPNLTGDHVCVTPARLCQVSAGYVQTGANRFAW